MLPFPAAPHLRAAQVGEINCFENVAAFPNHRWRELSAYRPQILAAEPDALLKLAEYVFHGVWTAQSLDTAVFALTVVGRGPLTGEQRSLLWRAFRVPVYELLIDPDEGILAAECEAHQGWHIRHPQLRFDLQSAKIVFQKHGMFANPVLTGLTADGLDGICSCGGASPLLRNVRSQKMEQVLKQAVRA